MRVVWDTLSHAIPAYAEILLFFTGLLIGVIVQER